MKENKKKELNARDEDGKGTVRKEEGRDVKKWKEIEGRTYQIVT